MSKHRPGSVAETGAEGESILAGHEAANRGLHIKVTSPQSKGHTGWVIGSFQLIAAGGEYKQHLAPLVGQHFTAQELIGEIAPKVGKRTLQILNCGMLRIANESDLDQYGRLAADPAATAEAELRDRGANSEPAGQGYEQDPERRRAAELHAMAIARAYYEDQGFTVTDTSQHEPYDLECRRARQIIRVEVKGTTGAGESVLLTSAEVENARQPAATWRTDLFVVYGIEIDDGEDGPTARGGEVRLIESWSPDLDDLEVTEYRYRLPAAASATR